MMVTALVFATLALVIVLVGEFLAFLAITGMQTQVEELATRLGQLVAPPPSAPQPGALEEELSFNARARQSLLGVAPAPYRWGPPLDDSLPTSVTEPPVIQAGDRDTFDVEEEPDTTAPTRGQDPRRDRHEDELR